MGWATTPKLHRFIGVPKVERDSVGVQLGRRLRARLEAVAAAAALETAAPGTGTPTRTAATLPNGNVQDADDAVLVVEKPYLRGFAAGFALGHIDTAPPFVLLVINGGDAPATPTMLECE
jgi:hypothetical protein